MASDRTDIQARERLAGLALIASAGLAVIAVNSAALPFYQSLLHFELGPALPRFGRFDIDHWVSEALMSVFFLLIGLEVKREWYEGRLADPARRRLPILAAIGGMIIPALLYLAFVGGDPDHVRGWAIPAATDIAFAIGVLALLGRHAPSEIKVLLVTIAIVDDVGAVAIIALFYTSSLNVAALGWAVAVLFTMAVMAMFGVRRLAPYLAGFVVLWFLVLASGIHATVAGVMAALTIPLSGGDGRPSPLKRLEHAIHPWVMFGIVPLFGFTSAGVQLDGGLAALGQPIAAGVMLGLAIGKPVGVFGSIWLANRLNLAPKPPGITDGQLLGAAVLTGIGFTMSLFIGSLAFPEDPAGVDSARLGTLAGSLISALVGFALLRLAARAPVDIEEAAEALEIFGGDQEEVRAQRIQVAVRPADAREDSDEAPGR